MGRCGREQDFPGAPHYRRRIEGPGRRGRRDIADYVLVYRNAKLAVIYYRAFRRVLFQRFLYKVFTK